MSTKSIRIVAVTLITAVMVGITACTAMPKGNIAEQDYTVGEMVVYHARYKDVGHEFEGFDSLKFRNHDIMKGMSARWRDFVKKRKYDLVFQIADSLHMIDRRSDVTDTLYVIRSSIYTTSGFPIIIKTKAKAYYINQDKFGKINAFELDRVCGYRNRPYYHDFGILTLKYSLFLGSIFSWDYDRICNLVKIIADKGIVDDDILEAQRFIITNRKIDSYQLYIFRGVHF